MSLSVDLFGGGGGWDLGAQAAGVNPIGIELDPDACATRAAAGLTTIRADLLDYTPADLHVGRLDGLIASPPCPAFSASGNGSGRAHLADLCTALDNAAGRPAGYPRGEWSAALAAALEAGRTRPDLERALSLLVYPLQWVALLRPRWIAFEQVPPVLPFWKATARWLRRCGYQTWAGILCAADYGVPQQRYRAFMLAHRDRPASPRPATHAEHPRPTLFGDTPEPWVTMAQALDLDAGAERNWTFRRPATTVQGDTRIWPPGHKVNQADIDRLGEAEARARYGDRAGTDAIKITIPQAAVLQGFPPDWPFQGTVAAQALQVGNAVPPPVARAIVERLAA